MINSLSRTFTREKARGSELLLVLPRTHVQSPAPHRAAHSQPRRRGLRYLNKEGAL